MFIPPHLIEHLVAAVQAAPGRLWVCTCAWSSWASLHRWLSMQAGGWLVVRITVGPDRHVVVIGSGDELWDGGRRVSVREAIRLLRLWLNLRRPDEVAVSPAWRQTVRASHASAS
jgi:hypothetical protein